MQKVMEPNYTIETFKSKADWLKNRGLGGSSASAILGKNPHMSVLELYKAIVKPHKHPIEKTNENMAYGVKCEPIIRRLFAIDFKDKYKVIKPKNYQMYRRKDKPYMTATLDSELVEKKTNRIGIHEIKTHDIRNRKDEEEWKDHLPDNYFIQVLHYFLVRNDAEFAEVTAKLNFYDFFDPEGKKLKRTETRYYHIEREDVLDQLVYLENKETDFWENNIVKKSMPSIKFKF
jgi:Phage-related protein, predicted endonuclease